MSTSLDKTRLRKPILSYLFVSLFLLLFVFVYERFSHGVTSNSMRMSVLVPLIFGSFLFILFYILPIPFDVTIDLWNMSMTTWICGLILDGVYFIYGVDRPIVHIFYYIGGSISIIAIVLYIYQCTKSIRKNR